MGKVNKMQIVTADTIDEAKKIVPWADTFQRTKDWKITNNWICANYVDVFFN